MINTIIFADWDDPDILQLKDLSSCIWIKLGLDYKNYKLFLDAHHWELQYQNNKVTSEMVENLTVVFRRWRTSPPRPIVLSKSKDISKEEASYIERQWDASLFSALLSSWEKSKTNWSRCPIFSINKIDIYRILKNTVNIPDYWISQSIKLIGHSNDYEYVLKPIHQDQSFGYRQRASTIRVTNGDDNGLQPCPSILQKRIFTTSEWRVGFFFGKVAMVSVTSEADHPIDLRYAPSVIKEEKKSKIIEEELIKISKKLSLNMFTADILFDNENNHWWCDINPDGLFLALDDVGTQPFLKLLKSILQ